MAATSRRGAREPESTAGCAVIDPHAARLHYRVVPAEGIEFRDPPEREWAMGDFRARVHAGEAAVEMVRHCATEEEARALVEPALAAWEIEAGLRRGSPEWRFAFERAEVIDRAPSREPASRGLAGTARVTVQVGPATLLVSPLRYPEPPVGFVASHAVRWMWLHWVAYRQDREPLAAMAYLCLTILERDLGVNKRKDRAVFERQLGIAAAVVNELGRLTAQVGDELDARKANDPERVHRAFTPQERDWIERVVLAMIRRAGEWAFDSTQSFTLLTLADFPTI
jgi:hypothetical protein